MSVRVHRRASSPGQRPDGAGTIRGRLLRILALPLVAIVALLVVVAYRDVGDYRAANGASGAVRLVLGVGDLVQELQEERGLTAGLLGGDVGFRADLPPERHRVDVQRTALAALLPAGGTGVAAARTALAALDSLASTRTGIDAGKLARGQAFSYFTDRIAALESIDFGLESAPNKDLRRSVNALRALADAKESEAQERALLNGIFAAGHFGAGEYQQYVAVYAAEDVAMDRFDLSATAAQRALKDAALDSGAAREAGVFEQRALSSFDKPFVVDPQSWWSALTTVLDHLRAVQRAVGTDITALAGGLQRDTTRRLVVLLVLGVACVLGSTLVLTASARSVTRPLRELAAEADNLAGVRLPAAVGRAQRGEQDAGTPPGVAVPAGASREVRSVASALERVQATAYSLATEQAVLRRSTAESLANLGRRNQNLLRRQLSFITRLEQEESDPQGLANLFELDHLATRMRRNAESLLVLVGQSTPRRWSAPLPLADVVRAAISEVEEYRRVSLKRIDDAYVGGAYVAGLAHMVAELVENGLSFSSPDLDVEIQGRGTPGGGYLIAITDQGVGMEPQELDRANARLGGQESYLSVPTRYLGHYVVGHLAGQMGIDVQVAPSPVTGVTARLSLPATVLASPAALPAGDDEPVAGRGPARTPAPREAGEPDSGRLRLPGRTLRAQVLPEPVPAPVVPELRWTADDPLWQLDPPGQTEPLVSPLAATVPPEVPDSPQWMSEQFDDPLWTVQATADPVWNAQPSAERPVVQYVPMGETVEALEFATTVLPVVAYPRQPLPRRDAEQAPVSTGGYDVVDLAEQIAAPAVLARSAESGPPDGAPRTRNGLRKRVPRSRPGPGTAHDGGRDTVTAPREAPVDSSPEQVRMRITSLRAGVRRVEGTATAAGGGADDDAHPTL